MEIVDPKYFDYAASTPPFRESLEIYTEVSGKFYANPSSMHRFGKEARQQFLALKNQFAVMAGFFDGRLLF